jgi:RNA-dependent RNA polymerase
MAHSPSVHRVYAVGMPPEDKICFFRDLKTVVVLPIVGTPYQSYNCPYLELPNLGHHSLASCLGEGNLDG